MCRAVPAKGRRNNIMTENKIRIKGWAVIPVLIIAGIIVVVRVMAILNGDIDPSLRKEIENRIYSDRVSTTVHQATEMKKATGQVSQKMASQMVTVAKEKPVIKSVRTTKSILEFSTTKRDVIVEVVYTIGGQEKTAYYRFEHSPGWKAWRLMGTSSKTSFYMHLF